MTKAEYNALYLAAQRELPYLSRKAMIEIRKAYIEAGKLVALEIRRAELSGKAELTIESLRSIQRSLDEGAIAITNAISINAPAAIEKAALSFSKINEQYLFDVIDDVPGLTDRVTKTGIVNMMARVNRQVIASIVNRVYRDGYTYSERVWMAGQRYQDTIKRVVTAGLAQGRDPVRIAGDISVYVKSGREAMVGRWGKLQAGTRAFRQRIPKTVDYNAVRLVRSELWASVQDSSRLSGIYNPACTQEYLWVRATNEQFNCSCPSYAGRTFKLNELPDYPHPNCLCRIVPILMDRREFVNDLKQWVSGQRVDYIDEWYQQYYR